jgi:hypothetical protein
MEKQGLSQLSKSKFFKHVNWGSFRSIYICRAYFQFIKILKTLFKHFSLDQAQYSNTPLLHYSGQFCRLGVLSIKQPQNVAIQYDCNGASHA